MGEKQKHSTAPRPEAAALSRVIGWKHQASFVYPSKSYIWLLDLQLLINSCMINLWVTKKRTENKLSSSRHAMPAKTFMYFKAQARQLPVGIRIFIHKIIKCTCSGLKFLNSSTKQARTGSQQYYVDILN